MADELDQLPKSGSIEDKIEIKKERKLEHTLSPEPLKHREVKSLFGFRGPQFGDDPASPDFVPLRERSDLEQAKWWASYYRRKEKLESIYGQVEFDPVIVEGDNFKGFYGSWKDEIET